MQEVESECQRAQEYMSGGGGVEGKGRGGNRYSFFSNEREVLFLPPESNIHKERREINGGGLAGEVVEGGGGGGRGGGGGGGSAAAKRKKRKGTR